MQDKHCHKDIGAALEKLTLLPSSADKHQVIRPFLHVLLEGHVEAFLLEF